MKQLYILRHCQAEGQAPDAGLTPTGREQARQLALFLADFPIEKIISSPFQRAQKSIEPYSRMKDIDITIDERLSEWILSTDNLPDWRERLEEAFQDPNLSFPGGETNRAGTKRAMAAIEQALDGTAQHVALVTHGGLMTLILQSFDSRFGFNAWAKLTNPDVFRVTLTENGNQVERIWK